VGGDGGAGGEQGHLPGDRCGGGMGGGPLRGREGTKDKQEEETWGHLCHLHPEVPSTPDATRGARGWGQGPWQEAGVDGGGQQVPRRAAARATHPRWPRCPGPAGRARGCRPPSRGAQGPPGPPRPAQARPWGRSRGRRLGGGISGGHPCACPRHPRPPPPPAHSCPRGRGQWRAGREGTARVARGGSGLGGAPARSPEGALPLRRLLRHRYVTGSAHGHAPRRPGPGTRAPRPGDAHGTPRCAALRQAGDAGTSSVSWGHPRPPRGGRGDLICLLGSPEATTQGTRGPHLSRVTQGHHAGDTGTSSVSGHPRPPRRGHGDLIRLLGSPEATTQGTRGPHLSRVTQGHHAGDSGTSSVYWGHPRPPRRGHGDLICLVGSPKATTQGTHGTPMPHGATQGRGHLGLGTQPEVGVLWGPHLQLAVQPGSGSHSRDLLWGLECNPEMGTALGTPIWDLGRNPGVGAAVGTQGTRSLPVGVQPRSESHSGTPICHLGRHPGVGTLWGPPFVTWGATLEWGSLRTPF
jgi:hypothetical protein